MDPNALAGQISQLDQSYNPTDTYNKITTQLGIPDARTRVQALSSNLLNTENAIRAVDPNVTARTSNSLVTEAQRGRLVNMEKAPLTDTYSQQNQAYGKEQGNLNDLTGQATQQAGLAESDYKNKRQSLADQLNTAIQQQTAAAAKADADRAFAEQQRQFNVTTSINKAKASASSSSQGPPPIQQGLAQLFTGYVKASQGGTPYYTENTIIPQVMSSYGLSKADAAKAVYNFRKQTFGE